jgi:hypothetical protein
MRLHAVAVAACKGDVGIEKDEYIRPGPILAWVLYRSRGNRDDPKMTPIRRLSTLKGPDDAATIVSFRGLRTFRRMWLTADWCSFSH